MNFADESSKGTYFIAALILCFIFFVSEIFPMFEYNAAAEVKADKSIGKAKGDGYGKSSFSGDGEPTIITANSLTADNKAKTALFTGSVVAKKGDGALFADRMLVYYKEAGDGKNSNIDRIECTGNVRLVRDNRIITAGKAVYYAGPEERAVFTENPRATENRNVITGTVMTYYFKDDRSVVENSKIFIVEKESASLDRKPAAKKKNESSSKKK